MYIAHRIRLAPNNAQRTYLGRAAGVARFTYNWALSEWRRQYHARKANPALQRPSQAALRRQLNNIKRQEFPWMLEVTSCASDIAIIQLGQAFDNFFAGRARYPRFRRKGADDRFAIRNSEFRVEGKRIRIPKLGWVRMREPLRFEGHVMSASVSRTADHWYVSITVNSPKSPLPRAENQGTVGVDLGVITLATMSTGEKVSGPKNLDHILSRVRRLSRTMARKLKGSRNREKAKLRLARLHEKVANVRRNNLHQLTSNLTRRFHTIGIEDLNVKGMLKNSRLARAIANMGFSEFRRQLKYKAVWSGSRVVIVDRWYPSSKTCSECGDIFDALPLAQRNWICPTCGASHDRDVNAAINLKNMAVSSTVTACGGEGAGLAQKRKAKPALKKQESNRKVSHG